MSKKFVAHKERAARHAKNAATLVEPVVEEFSNPARKGVEREKAQMDRVLSLLSQSTEYLEAARIERIVAIRDMEMQLADYPDGAVYRAGSAEARSHAEWREMTQCALRHSRVRLVMIEEVLRTRQKPGLFQRAVENLFDESDLADVWAEVKRLQDKFGTEA